MRNWKSCQQLISDLGNALRLRFNAHAVSEIEHVKNENRVPGHVGSMIIDDRYPGATRELRFHFVRSAQSRNTFTASSMKNAGSDFGSFVKSPLAQ